MRAVLILFTAISLFAGLIFGLSFLIPANTRVSWPAPTGGSLVMQRGTVHWDGGEKVVKTNGFAFMEDKLQKNAAKDHFTFSLRPMGEEFDLAYFMLEGTQAWVNVMVATNSSAHERAWEFAQGSDNAPSFIGTNATFLSINFEIARREEVFIPFMHKVLSNVFLLNPSNGLVFDP